MDLTTTCDETGGPWEIALKHARNPEKTGILVGSKCHKSMEFPSIVSVPHVNKAEDGKSKSQ